MRSSNFIGHFIYGPLDGEMRKVRFDAHSKIGDTIKVENSDYAFVGKLGKHAVFQFIDSNTTLLELRNLRTPEDSDENDADWWKQ